MGWIVGALAAATWVAPAIAQTGATSDSARAGTGAATTAPTGSSDLQGVPSGSTRDPSAKGPSGGSVVGERGSAASSGTGSSATSSGTGNTTATGTDTSTSTSTAPPTTTSDASSSETEKPGRSGSDTSASQSRSGAAGGHASAESETLQKLHAGNQAEIQAGQWMQEHAQSSKVKDFAKKMVKDHTDMDKDVQKFAQKQGISLTGAAAGGDAAKDEQHTHMMKDMPAAQADRHYMTMMVEDHQRDVSEVRSAAQQAKSSNDKDLAKLLDKTAKKMEDHLKDAQKIQREMGSRQARTPGQQ
jgi:putative membrane protein